MFSLLTGKFTGKKRKKGLETAETIGKITAGRHLSEVPLYEITGKRPRVIREKLAAGTGKQK